MKSISKKQLAEKLQEIRNKNHNKVKYRIRKQEEREADKLIEETKKERIIRNDS